ncbi:MAG: NADH-quinone oxidoreductase subunit N [Phycisphaerae bacterium]|nr:NADH-quinone oxidoreductase subunit N [Phycisphaerae bacterium]
MLASGYIQALSPELMLIVAAVVALIIGMFGRGRASGIIFLVAAAGIAASAYATVHAGCPCQYEGLSGIKLGAMATYTRLITLAIGALLLMICWHLPGAADRGEFFGMVLFSMTGAMLTGLADDLVVLLIGLELVSMPTYILVATGRSDVRAQEAGVKYFFLGAMASALAAYGFSFLYGVAGTTTISAGDAGQASIAQAVLTHGGSFIVVIGLALTIFGLAFKVAAVPLHFYAADVYEGAAAPVTGMLGFMPKLAGFVALAKILGIMGTNMPEVIFWLVWGLAAATMIVGNVLALMQSNVKRILAYSSVAHSGYMLVAVLVGPAVMFDSPIKDGVGAMMFYIAIYGATNLGAFAVVGLLRARGAEGERLEDLAGLSRAHPAIALALAICAFSLMGMPPTAGFIGKVYIFGSALSLDAASPHKLSMVVLAVVGLLTSAIGAVYYLRIIAACYLREPTTEVSTVRCGWLKLGVGLAAVIVMLAGLLPNRLVTGARQAASDVRPAQMAGAKVCPDKRTADASIQAQSAAITAETP